MDIKTLNEIKARCEKATRGPWEVKTNRHPETTGEAWGWIKGPCENWCWTDRRSSSRHDAEFIAHARTDIPALLAEVEYLTTKVKHLKQESADKPLTCDGCVHFNRENISDVCIDCCRLNRNDYYQRKTEGRK